MSLTDGIVLYLILLVSLSVHEWAHAWTAMKLGDRTAASMGRVTFNPIAHMDPIGTVLLPIVFIFFPMGFAIFGWGKPVPVDPRNFSKPVRDDILVAMAGPFSNLVICLICAILYGLMARFGDPTAFTDLFRQFIIINSVLIVFNLVPIPPLDGSHVMRHMVRMSDETYFKLAQYGFIIILVLINIPAFRSLIGMGIGMISYLSMQVVQWIAG